MWVRNFDTHQTVVVADMDDSFTDYFTEMFGTHVWRPLADLPEQRSNYGRADYDAQLAGYSAHARAWGVLGVWWSCIFIVVGWGRRRAVAGCWLVAVVVRG